jgi:acetolactate synthase-1/2/3 large subunit
VDAVELAAAAAKVLAEEGGADVVFGLPGGGNNLELLAAAEGAGTRFVLAHTETAAACMAGAFSELTGAPSACVVTRGPGAASGVNGTAQAWLDRQPLLMITDTVPESEAARVPHQRLDQRSMFAPITKWSATLGAGDPGSTMRHAIEIAGAPTPGPVHLDFDPSSRSRSSPPPSSPFHRGAVDDARRRIARARRPVVLVGMAARSASASVRDLVRGTAIPVLQTYKAKGTVPESWPNCVAVLTGATIESPVIEAADLVVALGLDTVELIPRPWRYAAPVISLSPWPTDNAYIRPSVELIGPLDELIAEIAPMPDGWHPDFAPSVRERDRADLLAGRKSGGLAPTDIVRTVRAAAPAGSLATVDSGAHMLPVTIFWDAEEPATFLASSGLATMGFSVPAAIAAALAVPDRRVFCFTGDGGLGMVLAELETLARLHLPVTVIVFNDSTLSLIKLKQQAGSHGGTGAVTYLPTDFAAMAEASGVPARRVRDAAEVDAAIRWSIESNGPALIDAITDPSEYAHILHTVRGGKVRG